MFRKCSVVNCNSRRESVRLFQFPKSETTLLNWLKCLPHTEQQKSLSELRKKYVCEKHFEKHFLTSKSRLRMAAYPTLFTAEEIASGIPNTSGIENRNPNPLNDHDYLKFQHFDHTYCKQAVTTFSGMNIRPVTPMTFQESAPSLITDTEVLPSTFNIKENELLIPDNAMQTVTTPKRCRKRLLHKIDSLSPNCKKLLKEYRKSRRQLNFHKRAKTALKFSKEKSFQELTKLMSPLSRKILWMQIKLAGKKTKGRRFTNEEKLISLSILKQSPKCYKFLQKIFILPRKQTLNKFVSEIKIDSGINLQIFTAIKQEVENWEEYRRYCSIMFDEVALETGLSYDKNKDFIEGFVELEERTNEFADHALVFMLRGTIYKWQQPVAFYFCKGATTAVVLKNIIKSVVTAVLNTGLIPVALVSDQGSAFQSALTSLQEEAKREQILGGGVIDDIIIINGQELSVVYDPPHLFKGLRNNFLNKHIKMDGKISKWSDIVEVYETDCKHAQVRLLHKITDECVIPEKIKKMKVKNCARVFSKTMAATLNYTAEFANYSDGKPVSRTLRNTAEVTSFFDDLFDSVNGACLAGKRNKGKPLRTVVTKTSPHHKFWREAIEKLKNMRFIHKGKEITVPSQKNWVTTLKSYIRLWQFFEGKNIKYMRPRYLNSDPIENFFGQVRAYNFRNNNPDCRSFKCTFRSLLITRFIKFHSDSFNCEEDSAKQLLKLQSLFNTENSSSEKDTNNLDTFFEEEFSVHTAESSSTNVNPESFHVAASRERLNVHSQAYTTGWVVRKILKKIKCSNCENNLTAQENKAIHKWISFREYNSLKNKRKLSYPSEQAVRLFKYITKETIEYLEEKPEKLNILKEIKEIIKSKYSMDFLACGLHREVHEDFMNLTIRLTIFNWCNTINKILRGTDISRIRKHLPPMQQKACNKYKTKLKNKNLNKYFCILFLNLFY